MKHTSYNPKRTLAQLLMGTSVAASVFTLTVAPKLALAEDVPDLDDTSSLASDEQASDQANDLTTTSVDSDVTDEADPLLTENAKTHEADVIDEDSNANRESDVADETVDSASETVVSETVNALSAASGTTVEEQQTVEDGVYTIASTGDTKQLVEAKDENLSNGSNVQMYKSDYGQNQRWKISYNIDRGYYSIVVNGTDKALTVESGVAKAGANVGIAKDVKSLSQLWKILRLDGAYRFVSALNSSYVLDITYANPANGSNLELWSSNGNPYSQSFILTKAMDEVVAEDRISEGIYSLHASSGNSSYVISSNVSSTTLEKKSGATNQRVFIQDAGDGFYRLFFEADGGALAVTNGSKIADAKLVHEGIKDSPSQLWALKRNTSGSYTFINRASGLVLDIFGQAVRYGNKISAWTANGGVNQQFFLEKLYNAAAGTAEIINDGNYYLVSSDDKYHLTAKDTKEGSAVVLGNALPDTKQIWQFSRLSGSDYYTIGLSGTNYVLDVSYASLANESPLIVWRKTGGKNQQWKLVKNSNGYALVSALRPDLVIDLRYGQIKPGAVAQTFTATGVAWQSFNLRSASFEVENRSSIEEGVYSFAVGDSSNSKYVLDIPGSTKTEGAELTIYTNHGGSNQKFLVTNAGNRYYYLVNMNSGTALDASGYSILVGTKVVQWHGTSGLNQMWAFVKNADGSYKIVNRLSGLVLDVQYGQIKNESKVSLYYDHGRSNQKWWIKKAAYLNDGIYKIQSAANDSLVFDVPGQSSASGQQLALYSNNDQLNQRYQLISGTSDGTYRIRSGASGGYLKDLAGKVVQSGKSTDAISNDSLWKLGWNGKYITFVNVASGRTLTAETGIKQNSKLITTNARPQSNSQSFVFTAATLLQEGKTYSFKNNGAKGYLAGITESAKTNLSAGLNTVSSVAKFVLRSNSNGTYSLVNAATHLLADVEFASKTAGANVILYQSTGGQNQMWTVEIGDGGGLIFRNVGSKLALAVDSESKSNNVIQKAFDADDAYQLWIFREEKAATKLNGVDISSWDAGLKISSLEGDFVIVKSTEGTSYVNPYYKQHAKDALDAGKLLGFYHYANGGDPVAEAKHFYNSVKDFIGKAILVLDWEGGGNPSFGKVDVSWSKSFLDTLYNLSGGVRGLIYMSKSVTYTHDWSSVASKYPLWVAQYADMKTVTGYQKNPWTDSRGYGAWSAPTIFQYSSMGRPGGWNLKKTADLDVFYGSDADWLNLAKRQ